jgi:hypothetical protein
MLKLRKLSGREIRFLCMLSLVLALAAWRFVPRPWNPTIVVSTRYYEIASTADSNAVTEIGQVMEVLYTAYSNKFWTIIKFDHPKLKVRLYKSRDEFKRVNPGVRWAEAYYSRGLCHAYYSEKEVNPYHWMVHEGVHQLNAEAGHFHLEKWLEEGLANYFSCSRIRSNHLAIGTIDLNTYPVWWLDEIAKSPNLQTNLANHSIVPLRAIITNQGGPSLDENFNLYYLHWWTLTHFIFEHPVYSKHALELVKRGGDLQSFEKLISPVDKIQIEWHDHVRHIKTTVSGTDRHFLKTGELPKQSSGAQP